MGRPFCSGRRGPSSSLIRRPYAGEIDLGSVIEGMLAVGPRLVLLAHDAAAVKTDVILCGDCTNGQLEVIAIAHGK